MAITADSFANKQKASGSLKGGGCRQSFNKGGGGKLFFRIIYAAVAKWFNTSGQKLQKS
jgi:hypothetical protein